MSPRIWFCSSRAVIGALGMKCGCELENLMALNDAKPAAFSWRINLAAMIVAGGLVAVGLRTPASGQATDTPAAGGAAPAKVDFDKDIKPIFADSCLRCHQMNAANPRRRPSGGLRLDDKTAALKGGRGGKDIVPGDAANSLLYKALKGPTTNANGGDVPGMPEAPRGQEFKPLADDKIALIKNWIDQGAEWPDAPTTAPATQP
jgi:hypothetical protein